MARIALLSVLWIGSILGLGSAKEVVNCLDGKRCDDVHAVVQGPQDVDAVMRRYPNAKKVDFHGNLLTQFINRYPSPVQWERLNLSYNMLENDVFAALQAPQLKYIDITYNLLTTVTIPPSAVEFIAERNNLTSITVKSRNLQRLILPKNKLDSLRGFGTLPQLEELDLSCNQLEKLNINELSSMSRLNVLNLANNRIHIVEGNSPLASLQHLDLSSNLLTMIDEPFNSFPNIKYLYLQNNKIVMWTQYQFTKRLQQINIQNNDWDCKSIDNLKKHIRGLENVACTVVDSPYADRLIKYRKQEFRALMAGASQRNGSISCYSYKPNPCDGDDNRVYEVARAAINRVENLSKSNVQQLERDLSRENNTLNYIQGQIRAAEQVNVGLIHENEDLAHYINDQYQQAGLSGKSDTIDQLNEIFEHFENINAKRKEDIKAEERENEDKLHDINVLENAIEDEEYHKNQLLQELNNRNTTLNGYQARIVELNKQLSKRQP